MDRVEAIHLWSTACEEMIDVVPVDGPVYSNTRFGIAMAERGLPVDLYTTPNQKKDVAIFLHNWADALEAE